MLASFAADEDGTRGALHELLADLYPAAGQLVADHGSALVIARAYPVPKAVGYRA